MKRVISNPGEAHIRDLKISKTSMMEEEADDVERVVGVKKNINELSPPIQSTAKLIETDPHSTDIHAEGASVHVVGEAQSAFSSLRIKDGDDPTRSQAEPISEIAVATDVKRDDKNVNKADNHKEEEMVRQVSVEASPPIIFPNTVRPATAPAAVGVSNVGNPIVNTNTGRVPHVMTMAETSNLHGRIITSTKGRDSDSTVGSGGGTQNQWGWFEDVHVHENDKDTDVHRQVNGIGHSRGGYPSKSSKSNADDDEDSDDYVVGGSTRDRTDDLEDASCHDDAGGYLNNDPVVEEVVPKKAATILSATYFSKKGQPSVQKEPMMMAVTAPIYVLEESKSSQNLWKNTAGTRPPQPIDERAFFEKIWAQNFKKSQVDYQIPSDVLTATSPVSLSPFADGNLGANQTHHTNAYNIGGGSALGGKGKASVPAEAEATAVSSVAYGTTGGGMFYGSSGSRSKNLQMLGPYEHHHTRVNKKVKDDGTDDELTVVVRGDNVFGTTVSKSFPTKDKRGEPTILSVSISVSSYRVVESKKHGKYAQFLVIFCAGTFRDTVGVWKRYSDFENLSHLVTKGHESCSSAFAGMNPLAITEDLHTDHEMLPNAVTSWKLLKKRKRWFRCLDAGYLSLKAFLLERFLHDILFESSTPDILRSFVGAA